MDPMNVLQPNYMGDQLANKGVEGITVNYGWGVPETIQANPAASEEKTNANPGMTQLRRAKAREFGRPMSELGF